MTWPVLILAIFWGEFTPPPPESLILPRKHPIYTQTFEKWIKFRLPPRYVVPQYTESRMHTVDLAHAYVNNEMPLPISSTTQHLIILYAMSFYKYSMNFKIIKIIEHFPKCLSEVLHCLCSIRKNITGHARSNPIGYVLPRKSVVLKLVQILLNCCPWYPVHFLCISGNSRLQQWFITIFVLAWVTRYYCCWNKDTKRIEYIYLFTIFQHNFCVKPYALREPRRDPSKRRLNEHGMCIRQCQESNSQPVPSQAGADTTRPPLT